MPLEEKKTTLMTLVSDWFLTWAQLDDKGVTIATLFRDLASVANWYQNLGTGELHGSIPATFLTREETRRVLNEEQSTLENCLAKEAAKELEQECIQSLPSYAEQKEQHHKKNAEEKQWVGQGQEQTQPDEDGNVDMGGGGGNNGASKPTIPPKVETGKKRKELGIAPLERTSHQHQVATRQQADVLKWDLYQRGQKARESLLLAKMSSFAGLLLEQAGFWQPAPSPKGNEPTPDELPKKSMAHQQTAAMTADEFLNLGNVRMQYNIIQEHESNTHQEKKHKRNQEMKEVQSQKGKAVQDTQSYNLPIASKATKSNNCMTTPFALLDPDGNNGGGKAGEAPTLKCKKKAITSITRKPGSQAGQSVDRHCTDMLMVHHGLVAINPGIPASLFCKNSIPPSTSLLQPAASPHAAAISPLPTAGLNVATVSAFSPPPAAGLDAATPSVTVQSGTMTINQPFPGGHSAPTLSVPVAGTKYSSIDCLHNCFIDIFCHWKALYHLEMEVYQENKNHFHKILTKIVLDGIETETVPDVIYFKNVCYWASIDYRWPEMGADKILYWWKKHPNWTLKNAPLCHCQDDGIQGPQLDNIFVEGVHNSNSDDGEDETDDEDDDDCGKRGSLRSSLTVMHDPSYPPSRFERDLTHVSKKDPNFKLDKLSLEMCLTYLEEVKEDPAKSYPAQSPAPQRWTVLVWELLQCLEEAVLQELQTSSVHGPSGLAPFDATTLDFMTKYTAAIPKPSPYNDLILWGVREIDLHPMCPSLSKLMYCQLQTPQLQTLSAPSPPLPTPLQPLPAPSTSPVRPSPSNVNSGDHVNENSDDRENDGYYQFALKNLQSGDSNVRRDPKTIRANVCIVLAAVSAQSVFAIYHKITCNPFYIFAMQQSLDMLEYV
ncbi:hypothetical protein M427DRAFT_41967 [Gonapodya prolifera JEL478]|uniref:Uncharacterized protein n=1 Tax=Gonapodya prolifera (strain JEL478) TaxID=1344416 RepID=A0A139ARG3_GONPJ|nr:hypothetical protein M427DRAFT_41967 [Gonapodya prolifera JEL478]|eukprot:KXS19113.1 hypothetical protein M427DRAFT_41967 [Gonapodya prolifera JEL478]